MSHLTTILITAVLILVPLGALAEKNLLETWTSRLYIPEFNPLPNRHTPIHHNGTYLPPVIKDDLTLTPNHNPILLTTTLVDTNASLVLEPGTKIFAHENAKLTITGRLIALGTPSKPIIFLTNEQHPLNQTWAGILAQSSGNINMAHVTIQHASPAISCLDNSHVTLDQTIVKQTNLAFYQTSPDCSIHNSHLHSTHNGITTVNSKPKLINTIISANKQNIVIK